MPESLYFSEGTMHEVPPISDTCSQSLLALLDMNNDLSLLRMSLCGAASAVRHPINIGSGSEGDGRDISYDLIMATCTSTGSTYILQIRYKSGARYMKDT